MTAGQPRVSGPRFVIVGAGMAGILSAIKLQEAGLTDITVYEKAERLGGTWRENTYPGVACDVPSHLYRYSLAPNPEWSHVFSPGSEILAYFEAVARRYEVEKFIRYGTEIRLLEFRDGCWHIETAGGQADMADFVIAATGVSVRTCRLSAMRAAEPMRGPTRMRPSPGLAEARSFAR